jgi:hypothetical protein
MIELKCPLDGGKILKTSEGISCELCNTLFPMFNNGRREVPDIRCLEKSRDVTLSFTIPQAPLQTGDVGQFGIATAADFQCISREKIRKLYPSVRSFL